ncbi:hypothetical protein GIB67_028174 [Kingdonia uniflora]|uniref:Uncharacterized protein n=1 Tax=Kingdonia uniflora TaxID=39325 RepID=A0A7J7KZP9_9MAGN|nr:hypothetical protein GIB67_028174 [Kingdonia uniflora]
MDIGQQNTLINEESYYDGNVVLSKKYKASDMESGKDASVLESRTVHVRGQTWNDNIIWVKGNCLQRDDDELLDLRFRSVKQCVNSTVERKECLLDEVVEEETELELVLGELGLSRKKRVESRSKKVAKALSTRSVTGTDEGTRQTSGDKVTEGQSVSGDDLKEVEERAKLAILQGKEDTNYMVAHLIKGIWLGIEEQESELKKVKSELEKNLARAKIDALKEVKQLKAAHTLAIGQLQEEVDVIKADTYAEEEVEEAEVVKEMSLWNNDLESGLAREIETSKALLSAQTELQARFEIGACSEENADFWECQHKLDAALIRERILEGEIRAKDLLVKRKDDLLKDLLAIDADRNAWKDTYVSVKVRYERLKARFAKVVVPDVARSELLKVIVAYFEEEVKRLELERDTLFKLCQIRDTPVELR